MKKNIRVILFFLIIIFVINSVYAGQKSPAKAFLYSLIVPGSGQYYVNSKTKGNFFITIEAIGISAYFYESYSSNWKTDHYKSYADSHFNYSDEDPEKKSYVEMWHLLKDRVYASENLPYHKVGEYYELIGKLEQLEMFWEEPQQQDYYYNLRQDANAVYKRKNMILGGLLINHVVSAIDALIQAKGIEVSLTSRTDLLQNEIRIGINKNF